MSSKPNRDGMAKPRSIFEYWSDKIELLGDDSYVTENNKTGYRCFACGGSSRIERAHIIPLHRGGSNALANLHLLCASCHVESELIPDTDLYWGWFDRMREIHPAMHMQKRLERMYGLEWISVVQERILRSRSHIGTGR